MIDNLEKLTPGPWEYLRDGEAHYVISGITRKPIGVFTKEKDALNIVEILEQLPELLEEHANDYTAKEFNEVVEQVTGLEGQLAEGEEREAALKEQLEEKQGISPEDVKAYQKAIEEHDALLKKSELLGESCAALAEQNKKLEKEKEELKAPKTLDGKDKKTIALEKEKEELEEILVTERAQKHKIIAEHNRVTKVIDKTNEQLAQIQRLVNELRGTL